MLLRIGLKFWLLRHYWWLLTITVILGIIYVVYADLATATALPIIGSLLSLFYFIQKQKLEELRLFREIFKECNLRYDGLNEALADIQQSTGAELTSEAQQTLVDYFNLCGEEYLYYSHGYIDPAVWKSWENGMKAIIQSPRIKRFWLEEKKTASYYGLPL